MNEESEEVEAEEIQVDQTPPDTKREPRPAPFVASGIIKAMIPSTPAEYARMAALLLEARCVPAGYDKGSPEEIKAKVIIGLMKSVEIGVPPITGLNGIMIVNNRPSVWGGLAVSLVQNSGKLQKMMVRRIGPDPEPGLLLKQWDDATGYTVTMWRKGQEEPYVGRFTVNDARRAGLWENHKKQPWIYYPEDMLFNRARAKAMRMGFSDALHGMGIVEEERDIEAPTIGLNQGPPIDDDEPVTQEDLAKLEHNPISDHPIPEEDREKNPH